MSDRPSPFGWLIKLAVFAVLVAGGIYLAMQLMRPTALVANAARGKATRAVPGSVEVKAEFVQELKSEVGGRVASSELHIGSRVKQGDVLVQLDTGDVDLEIERISSEIVAAKRKVELGSTRRPELENKRDLVTNLERQVRSGAVSQSDLDREQRLLRQLEQLVELDEVNLRLALETFENSLRAKQREKTKMTITAPIEGVITDVLVQPGGLIGSNTPIGGIMTISRAVEGKLSEENFAVVKRGQRATVRFLTYGKDQYEARVTELRPRADPATQRYTVLLDVFLPEGRTLVPGLTGEVSIVIAERENAVIIPRRALVGEHVYVVVGGRVVRRTVEKGYESLNQVEILKGLDEGEVVIIEQQDRFREGDRVRTAALAE